MQTTELSEFGLILLFITGAILFVILVFGVSRLLRPHRPNDQKLSTYECGEDALGSAQGQFNPRFYIIALIFILFEAEIVFLYPWAVVFGNEQINAQTNGLWGWFAVAEIFLFIGILAIGLAYVWKKGYLDWVKPATDTEQISSVVPVSLYEAVNEKYKSPKVKI